MNISIFVLIICLTILAAMAFCETAYSHDPYSGWRQRNGVSCCNGDDCRATTAHQADDGTWMAWDGKQYLPVPDGRLLPTDLAGDGRSHICERDGTVYCFSPGQIRG